MDLALLGIIGQILQIAAIIVGVWLTLRQIAIAVRSASADTTKEMLDKLGSREQGQQRGKIYALAQKIAREHTGKEEQEFFTLAEVTAAARAILKTMPEREYHKHYDEFAGVIMAFEDVGVLVAHRMLPPEIFLDSWSVEVVRCWAVVGPMVERQREKRGEAVGSAHPYLFKHFEKLAAESEKYLRKNYPDYIIRFY